MRSIKVNDADQSICFTNQENMIELFNKKDRYSQKYYEEIHIHCNDLYNFEEFVKSLESSAYSKFVEHVHYLPHQKEVYQDDIQNYELIVQQTTNELATTKKLKNILKQYSDETIFRAIALHFGEIVENENEINIDLIRSLNDIYYKKVQDEEDLFFSKKVANSLKNILEDEKTTNLNISTDYSDDLNLWR